VEKKEKKKRKKKKKNGTHTEQLDLDDFEPPVPRGALDL
jgi:hypothetical protein